MRLTLPQHCDLRLLERGEKVKSARRSGKGVQVGIAISLILCYPIYINAVIDCFMDESIVVLSPQYEVLFLRTNNLSAALSLG